MINDKTTTQTTHSNNAASKKRIAIIGSGVSGLVCAHYLVANHEVTIFEANEYLGGHVNTIDVEIAKPAKGLLKNRNHEKASIDTGFIVFNERTYPNFLRLLTELDVVFQKTDMSFSVKNPLINFEYNGHTLNSLLSQRKNIISPKFWCFAKDIIGFNKHIKQLRQDYNELQNQKNVLLAFKQRTKCKRKTRKLDKQLSDINTKMGTLSSQTLGDYLATQNYGSLFTNNYLLPMVSAIWSMGLEDSKVFPLIFFAQFFDNHGLLDIINRPQWFTIAGGSKQYVNKLVERYAGMKGKAYTNTPVQSVTRFTDKSTVTYVADGKDTHTEDFDEVIFACHADVAKRLLIDATEEETSVLSAFSFTDNQAVLHTDTSALPKKPLAWASWNYLLPAKQQHTKHNSAGQKNAISDLKPVLTYHMNILQRLVKRHNYLVTLNQPINDSHVIKKIDYRHPVFDVPMTQAQQQWATISGQASKNSRTHFCGAYWFNGFHEDGVKSALRVCQSLDTGITILDTVNKADLANVKDPNPTFTYKAIPTKADKNKRVLAKRQVVNATTNTQLNSFFNKTNKGEIS